MATATKSSGRLGSLILPLALAQFVCSYAGSAMNVATTDIAHDLSTTVAGVQLTITLFTLTMAALMIPGSKLTDMSGRKKIFLIGLSVYGVGSLIALLAPVLGVMIFGYSLLEGLGTALLIPPVYIMVTAAYTGLTRARNYGIVAGAGGIGSAMGPLVGGAITTAVSWRGSFLLQFAIVMLIIFLGRKIVEPKKEKGPKVSFDFGSAILSGLGLLLIILGLQTTASYGWIICAKDFSIGNVVLIPQGSVSPLIVIAGIGILLNIGFYFSVRHRERVGKEPLIHSKIFHNRLSNTGLVTQIVQWLVIQGLFFTVSVYLQTYRHFSAVEAGLTLTATTIGLIISASLAARLASRRSQRQLIRAGFILTVIGLALGLALTRYDSPVINLLPGLFIIGLGMGIMLTSSVNLVQSAFGDKDQADISGLSRSVSNLGSSIGVSLVGSIIISALLPLAQSYGLAIAVLLGVSIVGLFAAILIPKTPSKEITPEQEKISA